MDVARASGTDLASSLRQNTFLLEKNRFWTFDRSRRIPRFVLGFRHFFSGSENMSGSEKIIGIRATLNLEVLSLPEGLVHSIRILEAPGVFLARRWHKC